MRTEIWVKKLGGSYEQEVEVPIGPFGRVAVDYDLLKQMLEQLGFEQKADA